ncbi:unnamed protein product [Durusdinium trenchii]|uniref:Uncharacterized protein n=1 Tax=Durusdinium trenchii TaxID=1381693 RepID=A0ABP0LPU4_9DINO
MPRSSRNSGLVVLVCFLFGGCTFVNTGLSRPISTARGHTQFWPMGHKQDMRTGLVQLPQQAMSLGQSLSASCLGPTLLGLWRSEYGVSYGYGSAVALSAYHLWRSSSGLAAVHLFCLILYGVRSGPKSQDIPSRKKE